MVNRDPRDDPAAESGGDDLAAELLARLTGPASGTPGTRGWNDPTSSSGQADPNQPTASASAAPVARSGWRRPRRKSPGEAQFSGPAPDQRDPVSAESAMAQVMADLGWQRNTQLAAAMARWEEIAGPEVAAHVSAESFTDGVLTLRADSTAWATQLRMLLPTLRTRIDATVGPGVVADINVQGPHQPRQRGAWRVKGRGPRDTYG